MLKKILSFVAAGIICGSCAAVSVCAAENGTSGPSMSVTAGMTLKGDSVESSQIKITMSAADSYDLIPTFTLMNGNTAVSSRKLDGESGGADSWIFKGLDSGGSYSIKVTVPSGYLVNGKSGTFTESVSLGGTYSFTYKMIPVETNAPTTEAPKTTAPPATEKPTEAKTELVQDKTEAPKEDPTEEETPKVTEPSASAADEKEEITTAAAADEKDDSQNVSNTNQGNSASSGNTKNDNKDNKQPSTDSANKENSAPTGVSSPVVVFGALGACAVIAGISVIVKKKHD